MEKKRFDSYQLIELDLSWQTKAEMGLAKYLLISRRKFDLTLGCTYLALRPNPLCWNERKLYMFMKKKRHIVWAAWASLLSLIANICFIFLFVN